MLQYPINVYPDKVAFDSTKETYDRNLHFTFKGDQLTCIFYRVYNYDTQEIVRYGTWHNPSYTPLVYNNESFNSTGNFLANLPKGKYLLQMMFTETRTSLSNTSFLSAFDRYVSRGKTTLAHTAHSDTIHIEDRINVIYPWNRIGNTFEHTEATITVLGESVTIRTTDMLMEMGGERVRIDSYNYETGVVELHDWFENNYPSGTPYKMYANFLVTEQYYFEVAAEPVVQAYSQDESDNDVWVTWNAHGGTFAGYFWQRDSALIQDGAGLKYFKVKLDKVRDDVSYNVEQSEKIYSQNVEYYFADDYDVTSLHGGNYSSREYRLTVDYVLQNGMTFTKQYTTVQPQRDDSKSVSDITSALSNIDNKVNVQWTEPDGGLNLSYRVYRINAAGLYNPNERQDKQLQDYANNPKKTLIADVATGGFNDYTLGNHKRVQYIIIPYDNSNNGTTVYAASVSPVIETDFYGYTITSLKDSGKNADGKAVYFKGDIWKFMSDIQDTDNVQNLNHVMHVGYGKYATTTSTDNNYMSGSLTASLGNMNCTTKTFEDDIEVVNAWRRFISQDCMFILRSQKGDVWLVKITDSSSTKYNESVSKLPVDFTFSWVECGDVDSILVVDDLPYGSIDRK